jgi:hypothetical protein
MRPVNPESAPIRVYNEKGMVVLCIKKQPSVALTFHQLQQLQYLLDIEPGVLDTAAYLRRELGEDAGERLRKASDKAMVKGEV